MKYTGRKGWVASEKDVWNLDYTLRPIIAAGLRKYTSNERWGHPPTLEPQEWEDTLTSMLYAFEGNAPDMGPYDFGFNFDEGRITRSNEEEYERYMTDVLAHEAKVQEGLDLFAKHYHSLWD